MKTRANLILFCNILAWLLLVVHSSSETTLSLDAPLHNEHEGELPLESSNSNLQQPEPEQQPEEQEVEPESDRNLHHWYQRYHWYGGGKSDSDERNRGTMGSTRSSTSSMSMMMGTRSGRRPYWYLRYPHRRRHYLMKPSSPTTTRSPAVRVPTTMPNMQGSQPSAAPVSGQQTLNPTQESTNTTNSTCSRVTCDFNTLAVNVFLDEPSQLAILQQACGISAVTATSSNGRDARQANIFDSAVIRTFRGSQGTDADLGSPNRNCPVMSNSSSGVVVGPGKGQGGRPGQPFSNCEPLHNLVIIQTPGRRFANDMGGCLFFDFTSPIQMVDMGLLDVGFNTTLTVRIFVMLVVSMLDPSFLSTGQRTSLTFLTIFFLVPYSIFVYTTCSSRHKTITKPQKRYSRVPKILVTMDIGP
jgi:hypothetical protein